MTRKASLLVVLLIGLLSLPIAGLSQDPSDPLSANDTLIKDKKLTDSAGIKTKRTYNPKTAAIRSAIFPGLGQIYNRKYWKVPIVYAALGTTGAIFFYNLKNYKDTRFAYRTKYNMRVFMTDSNLYSRIKDVLKPLSESSLRSYRDQFRRDIDYSAIFFLVFWGLNVIDASVDAHLKGFDVSPDLGFRLKPGYSDMAGTNGLSLVMSIGKTGYKRPTLPSRF